MIRTHETFRDRTGRRWLNQSVVRLMKMRGVSSETPQDTIRRLARDKVAEARTLGWEGTPSFDPELLAELQGIEVKCAAGDIRAEARLMPLPEGRLEIEYAAEAPLRRRRFSICHEIAHTLFTDCYEQVQHRRKNEHFDPVHAELELLCHVGAGEFLLPLEEFTASVAGRAPSLCVADEIGDLFIASQEAAMRRIVDLTERACCLLWVSERLKPAEERNNGPEFDFGFSSPKPKLRVDYQFPSRQWKATVPRHKSIPDLSSLYTVLKGSPSEAKEEDWSGLNLEFVSVEAVKSMHCDPETAGLMVLLQRI